MVMSHGTPAVLDRLEPRLLLSGAMIITSEALAGAFEEVADWYTRKGYPAEVVTVESINAGYLGADTQEKIRNCIRDYYLNRDVKYVLLGGDDSVVPDRDTRGAGAGSVPTDLYYSSLDGQWDADGDGIFGEASGDNVDFDYDTIVARYPVRTAGQVATILAKVKAYETAPPQADWATDMLAVGNTLWLPGDAQQKSARADATYVSPNWTDRTVDEFFDSGTSWDTATPGDYPLNGANLLSAMGNGYQFMHMATHGSATSWALEFGAFRSSTISAMTRSVNVPIVSTIACDTGAFDLTEPSLSEAFLRSDKTGTIIFIGSSREGWGIPGDWLGPSFEYSYKFYQEFLTGPTRIAGEVFAEMKTRLAWKAGYEGAPRWLQFAINFQGDPLVQMYRGDPAVLDPTIEGEITEGLQTYTVSDVPAGARVVLWQGEEVYVVGNADQAGVFSAQVSPTTGAMKVTVIAPDAAVFADEVSVVEPEVDLVDDDGSDVIPAETPVQGAGAAPGAGSFDTMAAWAAAGGYDAARLYGSAGDDVLSVLPGSGNSQGAPVGGWLEAGRRIVDAEAATLQDDPAPVEVMTADRPANVHRFPIWTFLAAQQAAESGAGAENVTAGRVEEVLTNVVETIVDEGYAGVLQLLDRVSLFMKNPDDGRRSDEEAMQETSSTDSPAAESTGQTDDDESADAADAEPGPAGDSVSAAPAEPAQATYRRVA